MFYANVRKRRWKKVNNRLNLGFFVQKFIMFKNEHRLGQTFLTNYTALKNK